MSTTTLPTTDLRAAIPRARLEQRNWANLPIRQRLRPVTAFRRLLVRDTDRLAEVIGLEVGKSSAEVVGGDILSCADACKFVEKQASSILHPRRVPGRLRPLWLFGQSDVVHRKPRGVVGIIGTWNYPLFLNGVQIVHALVAGNAVVWKPSEVTPAFADVLHELLLEAGFPAALFHKLPATREMGPALAEADIDHIVFTGSATVGRKLAAKLGERLVSSTLELSGCDLQLVLDDADPVFAARAAWFGATLNRGQTCIAVRRAMVHRSLYSAFCDRLKLLNQGAEPMRLAIPAQVHQAKQLVDDALSRGGKLLLPQEVVTSNSECRPTVVIDANEDMALCHDACFAPIFAVTPFDTLEEALERNERCPYALGASIFTPNLTLAGQIANRLKAGSVAVNDVILPTSHPATPFGGSGASGWGTTQGAEGLLEMTVPQVVSYKSGTLRLHYDMGDPVKLQKQGELLRGFLEASHAPSFGRRLKGWWKVIRTAMKGL